MTFLSTLSQKEIDAFFKVIQDSLSISRHQELFRWLNNEVQLFIPHDILLTAWGDFSLGLVHLDVVSSLPGLRTMEVGKQEMLPLLMRLFQQWVASDRKPYRFGIDGKALHFGHARENADFNNGIASMRTALVQGIKDERGRHDCLYIALSSNLCFHERSIGAMELLLPYIDAALRQVAHLPVQYPDTSRLREEVEHIRETADADSLQGNDPLGLSQREMEIMHWICMGKTNSEIGQILDISFFTVKNHAQRIFRKLDVLNRTQAVDKFKRLAKENRPSAARSVK
jgi:transcriptional regulator EpsA